MRRVLVIDDHEPSRKILIDTLSQGGYQIAGEGATGNTAVALATTTLPDVVLMAVGLPDDYYVTMYKGNDLNEIPVRMHLWLENMTRIDLGNYSLRIFHTPGHTSGCISIIETTRPIKVICQSVQH